MRRWIAGSFVIGALAVAGCRTTTPAAAPPPPPAPSDCVVATGELATVTVSDQAQADPDCLEVKSGKTTVMWQGGIDVKEIIVTFKPGPKDPPPDPVCSGNTCTLEKAKHAGKKGDYAYAIHVVRADDSVADADPRLIIDR